MSWDPSRFLTGFVGQQTAPARPAPNLSPRPAGTMHPNVPAPNRMGPPAPYAHAARGAAGVPEQQDAPPLRIERVGFEALPTVRALNQAIFEEERVINTFDREHLVMLLAYVGPAPCAFKVGYAKSRQRYYSAKGGVLPPYRRRGIAELLNGAMMAQARALGFRTFTYDTFPNRHPGMAMLGLREGYRLVKAEFNEVMEDYRLTFETDL